MQTDILAKLINDKHEVLSRLHAACERQLDLVRARDTTALMPVLTAKQNLLEALNIIERQIDPFRAEDPEARQWRKPEDRVACREVSENCARLHAAVVALEQEGNREMAVGREQIAARLDDAHNGARARAAYSANSVVPRSSAFNSKQ